MTTKLTCVALVATFGLAALFLAGLAAAAPQEGQGTAAQPSAPETRPGTPTAVPALPAGAIDAKVQKAVQEIQNILAPAEEQRKAAEKMLNDLRKRVETRGGYEALPEADRASVRNELAKIAKLGMIVTDVILQQELKLRELFRDAFRNIGKDTLVMEDDIRLAREEIKRLMNDQRLLAKQRDEFVALQNGSISNAETKIATNDQCIANEGGYWQTLDNLFAVAQATKGVFNSIERDMNHPPNAAAFLASLADEIWRLKILAEGTATEAQKTMSFFRPPVPQQ